MVLKINRNRLVLRNLLNGNLEPLSFCTINYVVDTCKNCLSEAVLTGVHNIISQIYMYLFHPQIHIELK